MSAGRAAGCGADEDRGERCPRNCPENDTGEALRRRCVDWRWPDGANRLLDLAPNPDDRDRGSDPLGSGGVHRLARRPGRPRINDLTSSHQAREFVGQSELKARLGVILEAARQRQQAPTTSCSPGPPGLGKTSLAGIDAAQEIGGAAGHLRPGAGAPRRPRCDTHEALRRRRALHR
ncbi:MAG: hypothetical protein R2716_11285 [Microthrixaceae bacterium]